MVSIAVLQSAKSDLKLGPPSLRAAGLWYPDIPDPDVCLNEQSYLQPETEIAAFSPIFWSNFGGPGGMYLRHLTGMKVHSNGSIMGIQFQHDIDGIPPEARSLGRHLCSQCICGRPMEFSIDGPGGERITGIEILCEVNPLDSKALPGIFEETALNSFKVRPTNRLTEPERYIPVRFEVAELMLPGMYRFSRISKGHSISTWKPQRDSEIEMARSWSR